MTEETMSPKETLEALARSGITQDETDALRVLMAVAAGVQLMSRLHHAAEKSFGAKSRAVAAAAEYIQNMEEIFNGANHAKEVLDRVMKRLGLDVNLTMGNGG